MTVEKTQENLSTAVEKTEQALGGLENSLGNNEEASLLAIPENSEANDELPEGWVRATLADIAMWGSGGTPSRKNADYYGGEIPWVKTGDLGPRYVTAATEFITEEAVKNSSAKYFPKGSVALAMYGATIGKTSILGIDATTNQACAVGNPIENVTSTDYLYYFLKNEKDAFIAKGKGGAQPNISQALIKAHEISLPPLAEQTVIAQTLDTLLAQVDNIKTRLDAIPKILKTFRQSVLAAAVSGKLTEEWRGGNGTEFDSEILDELKADWMKNQLVVMERKSKKINLESLEKKYTRPVMLTGLPENLESKGWRLFRLGDLILEKNQGVNTTSEKVKYSSVGIPALQAGNIDNNVINYRTEKFIGTHKFETLSGSVKPEYKDVLYTNIGANFGNAAVIRVKDFVFAITWNVLKIKPSSVLNSDYLSLVLNTEKIRSEAWSSVSTSTVPFVSGKKVDSYQVPLPPQVEQAQIVHRVEELFAFADQIEQQVKNAQKRVNTLTQSILAKAFRGELTAQWRADNPDLITGDNSAKALLAKIQEEVRHLNRKRSQKKRQKEN